MKRKIVKLTESQFKHIVNEWTFELSSKNINNNGDEISVEGPKIEIDGERDEPYIEPGDSNRIAPVFCKSGPYRGLMGSTAITTK